MLKSSLIAYKINFHEKKLEEAALNCEEAEKYGYFIISSFSNEMSYHRFMLYSLEKQEKARIASLPWANAGQILHGEYKRDWTEAELKETGIILDKV